MAKAKGNIKLQITRTGLGRTAKVIYTGPQGKRTLRNLGLCDPTTEEGAARCAAAVDPYLQRRTLPDEASRV